MANPLKLSPAWIENQILTEEYLVRGGRFMVCIIYTKGGYYVTGESAPINPAEFTEELGRKYSREEAVEKIWRTEGIIARKEHYGEEAQAAKVAIDLTAGINWDAIETGFDYVISSTQYGEGLPEAHKYDPINDRFTDAEGSHWGGALVRTNESFTVIVRPGADFGPLNPNSETAE